MNIDFWNSRAISTLGYGDKLETSFRPSSEASSLFVAPISESPKLLPPSRSYGVPDKLFSPSFDMFSKSFRTTPTITLPSNLDQASRRTLTAFDSYSTPQRFGTLSATYGPPQRSPPSQSYGPPQRSQIPSQSYGPPQRFQIPSQSYGPPQRFQIPSQSYGPPQRSPILSQTYGPPQRSPQPLQAYGPPQRFGPSQSYGLPQRSNLPSLSYGPPQRSPPPSQLYGPPQRSPQPSQSYGPPQRSSFGPPQRFLSQRSVSNSYGPPDFRTSQQSYGGTPPPPPPPPPPPSLGQFSQLSQPYVPPPPPQSHINGGRIFSKPNDQTTDDNRSQIFDTLDPAPVKIYGLPHVKNPGKPLTSYESPILLTGNNL